MQESKLSGFDVWHSNLNRKNLSANNTETLAGYLACYTAETNAVSIIKLPTDFDSDELLLTLGEDYLGCINVKLKKSELLKHVELIELMHLNGNLLNWLCTGIDFLGDKLKTVNKLTDDEIAELKEIEKKYKNPFEKWVEAREKKLNSALQKMPKFLKRDF